MAKSYVYSTLTAPQIYVKYQKADAGPHRVLREVHIQGGTNVANKHLVTPRGVVTEVTEDDLEFLLEQDGFIQHVANGFITYDKAKVDPEVMVGKGMEQADDSAPVTPENYVEKAGGGDAALVKPQSKDA